MTDFPDAAEKLSDKINFAAVFCTNLIPGAPGMRNIIPSEKPQMKN
jgi:hypothetical protein